MIYRVTVRTTNSMQPGQGQTFWQSDVVYCGNSLEEARVEFLRHKPTDHWAGYGNRARETVIEESESEPDEIDNGDPSEVVAE